MTIRIPEGAQYILDRLSGEGYQAYIVGGCVRDALLGRAPKDWDVCTSATPEQMQQVFAGDRVVATGLQHGTLTVVIDHEPYEVTTFRVDGAYTDHRHPDGVTFVTDVCEDLARRDFTVNAMAYHPQAGLVDAFGGRDDLAARVIRCVGEPERRFEEDALRILRALRFASVYDFEIATETDCAIRRLYPTLEKVAAERVHAELTKLICGQAAGRILRSYHEVITFIIPELKPCVGFDQRTPFHRYDVWEHIVRGVEGVPPTEILRTTMLLHDSGKPDCFTLDEAGVGHMRGHQRRSEEIADAVTARLRYDNASRERIMTLVLHHDIPLEPRRPLLLRRLNQLGEEALWQLADVQRADALAKGTISDAEVLAADAAVRETLTALLADRPVYTLRSLAVNGSDLMRLGCPKGPKLGACLNALLEQVMDGAPNERDALLAAASTWLAQKRQ